MSTQWQPIETAPVGELVLCAWFNPKNRTTGMAVCEQETAGGDWLSDEGDPFLMNPTHWQPLPEPPQ